MQLIESTPRKTKRLHLMHKLCAVLEEQLVVQANKVLVLDALMAKTTVARVQHGARASTQRPLGRNLRRLRCFNSLTFLEVLSYFVVAALPLEYHSTQGDNFQGVVARQSGWRRG